MKNCFLAGPQPQMGVGPAAEGRPENNTCALSGPPLFWPNRDGTANESCEPIGSAGRAGRAEMGIFPQVKGGRGGGGQRDSERERPRIELESVTFARPSIARKSGGSL